MLSIRKTQTPQAQHILWTVKNIFRIPIRCNAKLQKKSRKTRRRRRWRRQRQQRRRRRWTMRGRKRAQLNSVESYLINQRNTAATTNKKEKQKTVIDIIHNQFLPLLFRLSLSHWIFVDVMWPALRCGHTVDTEGHTLSATSRSIDRSIEWKWTKKKEKWDPCIRIKNRTTFCGALDRVYGRCERCIVLIRSVCLRQFAVRKLVAAVWCNIEPFGDWTQRSGPNGDQTPFEHTLQMCGIP